MATFTSKNNLVIGSMRKTESGNGKTSWRFKVYVDDPENPLYPVAKGVQADRWTGVTDSYVNNIDTEILEDGVTTFLDIEAVPYRFLDSDSNGGQATEPTSPEEAITKTYDMKSVFFPMEWFGIKEAATTDISIKTAVATGTVCEKEKELVYLSGSAPDYSRCPYDGMPTAVATQPNRDAILAIIERNRRVYAYNLTFFKLGNFNTIADFDGINLTAGNFGGNVLLNPFNIDIKKWKVIDQQLLSFTVVKKLASPRIGYVNTAYVKLKRAFERAPGGLTFKAAEAGGQWTW